jgi:undecaprenyl-diphosphatase
LLILQIFFNQNINYEILSTITNLGSLIAIIIIFKDKIKNAITTNKNDKYLYKIAIATIPAAIVGLIITKLNLFDYLEKNIKFVGLTLIITAVFLFTIRNYQGKKKEKNITFKDSLIIGLFQIIALIPGISRSGSTIVGGMYRDLDRETSFNFSFMLYIPISIAAAILGVNKLIQSKLTLNQISLYLTSMVISFIFTYISINWFKNVLIKGKLIYFVYYCLAMGIILLFFI